MDSNGIKFKNYKVGRTTRKVPNLSSRLLTATLMTVTVARIWYILEYSTPDYSLLMASAPSLSPEPNLRMAGMARPVSSPIPGTTNIANLIGTTSGTNIRSVQEFTDFSLFIARVREIAAL